MDCACGESHPAEEWECPVAVALDKVIVDGDDMDLLALDTCHVGGEWSNDGFPFTGFHFGDFALS